MVAIKITRFIGTAPRNSPELLADTAAQVARNGKLYSGDLIPYPEPISVADSNRNGTVRTIYGLRSSTAGTGSPIKWLSFNSFVSIATPSTDELEERRFYYTGDGKPKVSNFSLATTGSASGPYPVDYYDLGLPLPTTKPTITTVPFSKATVVSYARDNANQVTLTTIAPHNLKTGAVASISGFSNRDGTYTRTNRNITVTISNHGLTTGATVFLEFSSGTATTNNYTVSVTGTDTFTCTDTVSGATSGAVKWDIRDLNTIASVSVINSTTISYFAFGPEIATTTVIRAGTYTQVASATATITLSGHKLISGDIVYLNFTSGTATSGTYDVTVINTNTFTVILPVSATTSGSVNVYLVIGTVDLGDQVQGRSYIYTWFTPWREESIGSEPTDPVYMREGQTAIVTSLPTAPPAGKNNIRGIRLYRSLASTSVSGFFQLKTLWFPAAISQVSRTSNVARVTMPDYHNLLAGDRIKLVCTSNATFNATDVLVSRVVSGKVFEFAQAGSNVATTAATGVLYYDIAERKTDPARYWGDGGVYTFTDDFSYLSLTSLLGSTEYEAPPTDMQGITALHNGMMAGFVGNDLYFCEPGLYHAWPSQYRISFEYDIVALSSIGGVLLVLTRGYPYIVEGSYPATMVAQKLAVMYPCVSAASVVATGFGIVWSTHDGLAVYGGGGAQLLTKAVHYSDTWNADVNPEEIVGAVFKENYIGSTSTAALTLEAVEGEGGTGLSFVDLDFQYSASWYDNETNSLYTAVGTNGDIYQWDNPTPQNMTMRWKSKVFITDAPMNLGAARVVADYSPGGIDSPIWETINDNWNTYDLQWDGGLPIIFNLYINKQLIFTTVRTDSGIFRLPTGYKSDTFEVEIYSPVRVRAIHIAETPIGLAAV
jgi:hypothetical protein